MDLSFSGAGFMGCYYFGIIDCWSRYIPRERVNRVAGASAGSLIAAYYLLDLPLGPCLSKIVELTEDIRSRALGVFDRSNQIVDILPRILDQLFPDDAHKRVSGKLFVCMTRLKDMKKVIVSEFDSKQELIEALNCSCFIPIWSGNHVSKYKGVKHIDGGFSDNLPIFDEHTIRICCFSGPSDIAPFDRRKFNKIQFKILNTPLYLSLTNLRRFGRALAPPPASFLVGLLEKGFHDAKQFILSNDLIQCDKCYMSQRVEERPFFKLLTPTISASVSRSESLEDLSVVFKSTDGHLDVVGSSGSSNKVAQVKESLTLNKQQDSVCNEFNETLSKRLEDMNNNLLDENVNENNNEEEKKLDFGPQIKIDLVVDDYDEDEDEDGDEDEDEDDEEEPIRYGRTGRRPTLPVNAPSEKFLQLRRNTIDASESLLKLEDKFKFAPVPLPSCPPSPNLNRHCTECIRMRHEARLDKLEDQLKGEAVKFVEAGTSKKVEANRNSNKKGSRRGSQLISRSITSPLKWMRQIGNGKGSYKFEA